jgi:hypothetical protein
VKLKPKPYANGEDSSSQASTKDDVVQKVNPFDIILGETNGEKVIADTNKPPLKVVQ